MKNLPAAQDLHLPPSNTSSSTSQQHKIFIYLPHITRSGCLRLYNVTWHNSPCRLVIDTSVTIHNMYAQCGSIAVHFNKINFQLGYSTRFAIQAKGPDDKWTRKPLAYRESNNVHLLITRPPEICVNLVFKHIHAASSYTIRRQFIPFIYCHL